MTDEQKQKRREANKRYKDNMSDERLLHLNNHKVKKYNSYKRY